MWEAKGGVIVTEEGLGGFGSGRTIQKSSCVTGQENAQYRGTASYLWGPCVPICLGQSWVLSFVSNILTARLLCVFRNMEVSLTEHKDAVIPCDLYTQLWLVALSIAVQGGPHISVRSCAGCPNSSEVGYGLSHGQVPWTFVSNVASKWDVRLKCHMSCGSEPL